MNRKSTLYSLVSLLVLTSLLLSSCGSPAAPAATATETAPAVVQPTATTAAAAEPTATTAAAAEPTATTAAAAQPTATTAAAAATGPTCGTGPVTMNAVFETGFDLPIKLTDEFTKQFPNVKWDIKQDQFANLINETPRLLAGDNPPDLIRLPTMVTFAKDGLLKNLDD